MNPKAELVVCIHQVVCYSDVIKSTSSLKNENNSLNIECNRTKNYSYMSSKLKQAKHKRSKNYIRFVDSDTSLSAESVKLHVSPVSKKTYFLKQNVISIYFLDSIQFSKYSSYIAYARNYSKNYNYNFLSVCSVTWTLFHSSSSHSWTHLFRASTIFSRNSSSTSYTSNSLCNSITNNSNFDGMIKYITTEIFFFFLVNNLLRKN